IILRTLYDGENARIEIEDNGPGIGEETRLHIFDPFFTTKDIGEGTGLGLYVCHSIVHDKHKGKVLVDSQLGHGARFTVELPI
ncbi:MAG: histidine kinase, partial [Desulfovibrionaceae bacterium]|nr:histidine kinase [Desulfovibrionaceae bacterium]